MSMRKQARMRKPAPSAESATGGPSLEQTPMNAGPQGAPASGHSFAQMRIHYSGPGHSGKNPIIQREAKPEGEEEAPKPEPITLHYEYEKQGQPLPETGWAAHLGGLYTFYNSENKKIDSEGVATSTGLELAKEHDWTDIQKAAGAMELNPQEVHNASPAQWAAILNEFGPFWLVENDKPDESMVISAMSGDGTAEGTEVTYHESMPMNSGATQTKRFDVIAADWRLNEKDHPKTSIVHGT